VIDKCLDGMTRHWRLCIILLWIIASTVFLHQKWNAIHWFALSDTDDNMRLLQVRAWLDGQGWYDLRNYKLDPPNGGDIHWSRLVDLPIAGLILMARPFIGIIGAEKFAVAIAPLIPLLPMLFATALTAQRLIHPRAVLLPVILMLLSPAVMGMFMPLRIDHHGWQLAMLAIIVTGLSDPEGRRSGIVIGLASVGSLIIGLEMLPYLAIAGGGLVLRWIIDSGEALRMRYYGAMLTFGVIAGYFGFASYANAAPRCDALTSVWTSTMMAAGGILTLFSYIKVKSPWFRLALAGAGGIILAFGFSALWPQCLARPEGISPELNKLWLQNIREVKPLYLQSQAMILQSGIAIFGIMGILVIIYKISKKPWKDMKSIISLFGSAWFSIILLIFTSSMMMLFWQTRAAPAAVMLGMTTTTALIFFIITWLRSRVSLPGIIGISSLLFICISGISTRIIDWLTPPPTLTVQMTQVKHANANCGTLASLRPIAKMPAAVIFTFVDLSPRLIAMTHHRAVAGPYHRNGRSILDIHHAFRGSAAGAYKIIKRRGAQLLLICPHFPESTLYSVQSPKGFYAQLVTGTIPDWLEPVSLPSHSPFMLWRVK
jgi:hypothetical protein